MGKYRGRLGWGVDKEADRKRELSAAERSRLERWRATGCARVESPKYGTVVVPHQSNLSAILNAAEVWGCDRTDLRDVKVWSADKEEKPIPMPHII